MNILLISHGEFCSGLLASYAMIAGENKQISYVMLNDDGIQSFSTRLAQRIESLLKQGELLILADIKGGTPFNEAYGHFLQNPDKIQLVSGMNLPMLIEVGVNLMAGSTLTQLADLAIKTGKIAIEAALVEVEDDALEF